MLPSFLLTCLKLSTSCDVAAVRQSTLRSGNSGSILIPFLRRFGANKTFCDTSTVPAKSRAEAHDVPKIRNGDEM